MKKLQIASVLSVVLAFCATTQAQDGQEHVLATLGGVQLVSKPVTLENTDYVAAIVEARATDPNASLVTFTNISITGQVAQLHSSFAPTGTVFSTDTAAGPLYGERWGEVDTHLLITTAMIAGGVHKEVETNDASLGTAGFGPLQSTAAPVAGIGPLMNEATTDAFFVQPEFQMSSIDVAYIVAPSAGYDETTGFAGVNMTLGLLGSGITDAGTAGGAAFGYDGSDPIAVNFGAVPEPTTGLMALMSVMGLLGLRRRK